MHRGWVDSALDGLVTGVARKTLHRLPRWYQPMFKSCFYSSRENVTRKASCLSMAFDRQIKYENASSNSQFKYSSHSPSIQRRAKRRTNRLTDPLTPYESYLGTDNEPLAKQRETAHERRSFELLQPAFGPQLFRIATGNHQKRSGAPNALSRLQRLMRLSKWQSKPSTVNSVPRRNSENLGFLRLMHDFTQVAREEHKSPLSLFSPQFLSLSLDDPKAKRLFSPRFLSLQKDEANSLDDLVETLDPVHKKEWMDLLLEVTGANDAAKEVLDWIDADSDNSTSNERHKLAKTHMKLVEHWATYMDSFNKPQTDELNKFGFTFVEDSQLNTVFTRDGPFNRSHLESFSYRHQDYVSKQLALEADIRQLALGSFHRRQKQVLLEPAIFAPGILAPSVLGHVTLSPSLFAPVILSPNALGPATLSPTGFSPIVLSPFVLSPLVLSPVMFSPAIMSPSALSPSVLSPYMFSPAILSPIVLQPDVLSPSLFHAAVMSPVALSPSILSPGEFFIDVLSPTVLS